MSDPLTTWLPPPAIVAAIMSGLAIALVLALGGRTPGLTPPATRFKAAVLIALALLAAQLAALALAGRPVDLLDALAGLAIVGAAAIAGFIAWSLIVWGFTLNMLLVLAAKGPVAGLEGWAALYTGGKTIRELTADRAGVLGGARLAQQDADGSWRLNRAGSAAAVVLRALQFAYGVRR